MNRFNCPCGAEVFFESRVCESCKRALAFNPDTLSFELLPPENAPTEPSASSTHLCKNGIDYGVCNWLAPSDAPGGLCSGCQYNRTIPNLGCEENIKRWGIIEASKKRLLYSLLRLGLPLESGWQLPGRGLLFDFLEDQRSNPQATTPFVTTGFLDGVITLNVLEADPALRFVEQQAANEVYRTVLGHLRHRQQRRHIAVGTKPANHGGCRLREYRVAVILVAGVDVGNVQLDDRALECLQRVQDCNRGE